MWFWYQGNWLISLSSKSITYHSMTLDAGMSKVKVSKDLMLSKAPFFKIAVWLRPHLANGQ